MTIDFLPAVGPVARLMEEFHKLPGIGPKSAQRLAFYLVRMPQGESQSLAEAILAMKERIIFCSSCQNISEQDPCPTCVDQTRDRSRLCVVEEPMDVFALERTGGYHGLYYVLHGAISPINGVGPEHLRIDGLVQRLRNQATEEVILATNPNLEGEATAMYLHRLIQPLVSIVTRLARGLPAGGDLEYADDVTLARALEGRQTF